LPADQQQLLRSLRDYIGLRLPLHHLSARPSRPRGPGWGHIGTPRPTLHVALSYGEIVRRLRCTFDRGFRSSLGAARVTTRQRVVATRDDARYRRTLGITARPLLLLLLLLRQMLVRYCRVRSNCCYGRSTMRQLRRRPHRSTWRCECSTSGCRCWTPLLAVWMITTLGHVAGMILRFISVSFYGSVKPTILPPSPIDGSPKASHH